VDAGVDLAMCSNDPTIQLDGSVLGASGGIWTTNGTGNFTPSATAMSVVYNPSTGDRVRTSLYAILTSTGNGICKAVSDTVVFTIIPAPTVDAGPDLAILEDEIVTLNPTVTGSNLSYVWSPGSYLSNTTVKNPQATGIDDITYTLTVKGTGGCEASDDLNILVLRPFIVPNTFTPNGDGVNDKWSIPKLSTYAGCKVQIFDRYGQLVFQSVGYWEPWDGKFKGKPLPVGTYYYIIETGKRKPLTGYVQILK
jgi:gliding motility-associated-like protein